MASYSITSIPSTPYGIKSPQDFKVISSKSCGIGFWKPPQSMSWALQQK